MRRTVEIAAVFTLVAALALTGCSDQSLPTDAAEALTGSFFTRPPARGFGVLKRTSPLTREITVSAVIDQNGGRIDVPEAGISFVVPEGALSEETEITLRALAGDAVAFEFAPHGLEFNTPARIEVLVAGTHAEEVFPLGSSVSGDSVPLERFMGVYFDGDPDLGVEPLENIGTSLIDGSIVFEINHFSGYATASG